MLFQLKHAQTLLQTNFSVASGSSHSIFAHKWFKWYYLTDYVTMLE